MAIHYRNPQTSERLGKLLLALRRAGREGMTTAQIGDLTGSRAPGTDISELRAALRGSGTEIRCTYAGTADSGAKVYLYRLIESEAAAA